MHKLGPILVLFSFLQYSCNNSTSTKDDSQNSAELESKKTILPNSSFEFKVNGMWKFAYIKNENGEHVKEIGENDFMILTPSKNDFFFFYELTKVGITASGNWELKDSLLTYSYNPKNNEANHESSYISNNQIIYTYKGEQVDVISLDTIERKKRSYRIVICIEDSLIFKENGITYAFGK